MEGWFRRGWFWSVMGLCLWATWGLFGACGQPTPSQENSPEITATPDSGGTDQTATEKVADTTPTPETKVETTVDSPTPTASRASGPNKVLNPTERGPYAVGVTTLRLVDEERKDPQTGKPRPMVIEIWYPAEDSAKNTPTDEYNVETDAPEDVKKKIQEIGLAAPVMKQDAHRDAPPLRTEGPYPLILFSHGSGGIRYQSVFQTTHLASHGYVVVSPDHSGNTLYDLFVNPDAQSTPNLLASASHRPIDMKFAMEAVKKLVETPGDRLHNLTKFDRIGVTGHSFGGLTSILVTRTFTNIAAIIPQAPATSFTKALGVQPEHLFGVIMMLLGSQKDLTLKYEDEQRPFFDLTITEPYFGADRHLVAFTRGGHFTFSNICELDLKKFADKLGFGNAAKILDDGCAEHNTPYLEAHKYINHYSAGLFNVILRGSVGTKEHLKQLPTPEIEYTYKPKP